MALSPQPAHQPSVGLSPLPTQSSVPFPHPPPVADDGPPPPRPAGMLRTAGRKRSRDEAAPNLVDDAPEPMSVEPPQESNDEWEYGEGMVLIKRKNGYVTDASSQSGTWVEERSSQEDIHRAAAAASARVNAQARPILRSNKSQRLDPALSMSGIDSINSSVKALPIEPGVVDRPAASMQPGASVQPVVDDFTLHLGIGWRKISSDEHIQAAARGWARYIENHFPVSAVNIRLQSSGLQAYLVEAAEGLYLFAEDLKQGRLVSTNSETALQNLKTSPPTFEGQETLYAMETPSGTLCEPQLAASTVQTDDDAVMI